MHPPLGLWTYFSQDLVPPPPPRRMVTKGMDVLHKLEALPTKREGIFVMPLDRITIQNSYWYRAHGPLHLTTQGESRSTFDCSSVSFHVCLCSGKDGDCEGKLDELKASFESQAAELQAVRIKCLPGS